MFELLRAPTERHVRYTSIMVRARSLGVLLVACVALGGQGGCADPVLHPLEIPPSHDDPGSIVVAANQQVDVLFVIDNSGSMAEEQAMLVADIGAFFEVLEQPEVAADYRIAFTTTDVGNPWCTTSTPEHGELRLSSCRSRPTEFVIAGGVPDTALDDVCYAYCPEQWDEITVEPTMLLGGSEAKPRPWIERAAGTTNLPQGLSPTQAFQCLAPQGIDGCGFGSPLEGMWKALQRAENEGDPAQGFVRGGAVLSVVFLTDGDDCSVNPDHESIFLPEGNRLFWSDPDAPTPTSAVCWNAGVICEGEGTYDDCRSIDLDEDGNEVAGGSTADALAVLRPVERYVDRLQTLENIKQEVTPDQDVLVSLIGGVASDGSVTYAVGTNAEFEQDFGIGPGCEGSTGRAVPPVRLRELAEAFAVGREPNMFSLCDDGYEATLTTIARGIADQLRPGCVPACVADMEPETPDSLEPSCRVLQEAPQADGSFEPTWVLPCEAGDVLPEGEDVCFVMLVQDERSDFCAELGFNLELRFVRREGVVPPSGAVMTVDCNLSQDKATDCPDLP